jgi:hypothetical protein
VPFFVVVMILDFTLFFSNPATKETGGLGEYHSARKKKKSDNNGAR